MTFKEAYETCHVRAGIFRKINPEKVYAKNHQIPMEQRVPLEDQMADDWEESDPEEDVMPAKLCNKKILANSLMEWTLGSTTIFIDAKENSDLIAKAKKMNIILPSPDLACFSTIYCELGKYNLNGVKFSEEVASKGLKTLIGKQINWNHEGAHQICGYIIDSEIKENKIYITGILFKSLFTKEFGEVEKLFAEKKLFVSFELWNRNEKGESIIKDLGNGKRELTDFIGHGCALLLIDPNTGKPIPPACPKAQVQKLLASEEVITEAEKIIDSAFSQDKNLVYAELATEEPKCSKCANCTCKQEGGKENIMAEEIIETIIDDFEDDYDGGEIEEAKKITYKQRQELPDSDFALIQTKDGKKIRRFPIQDEAHVRNALARLPQAKGLSEEEKKKAMNKILRRAKALNMTELLKRHEKALEEALAEPEEAIVKPVGDVPVTLLDQGKKYCSKCNAEVDIANMTDEEKQKPLFCALCKTANPEQAQVGAPASEQTQVEKPVEAHETVETVTQKPERKHVKTMTEETVALVDDHVANSHQKKGTRKTTLFYDDGTSEISTQDYDVTDTYSQAQLDGAVEELIASLPKEVTDCVREQIKDGKKPAEAVKHCWSEYKKSHEKAMADVVGEKDKKIQEITKELEKQTTEVATLKIEKAKVEEAKKLEPDLLVGDPSLKDNNEVKQMAKNVNDIIASKHNQN